MRATPPSAPQRALDPVRVPKSCGATFVASELASRLHDGLVFLFFFALSRLADEERRRARWSERKRRALAQRQLQQQQQQLQQAKASASSVTSPSPSKKVSPAAKIEMMRVDEESRAEAEDSESKVDDAECKDGDFPSQTSSDD